MASNIMVLVVCFTLIWLGAGFVVRNVEALAKNVHISRFVVSLFLLGFATSVSEIAVALNSLLYSRPQISVGNLMGSSTFLLLFVIPVVSLLGGSISIDKLMTKSSLVVFTIIVIVPLASALDGVISLSEGLILVLIYIVYMQSRSKGVVRNFLSKYKTKRNLKDVGFMTTKIIAGIGVVFYSSNIVVQQIIEISNTIGMSAFLLSIIIISVGTNIPELSIAIRSVLARKKDIAIGNYIGSVAINTPILGTLTLLNGEPVVLSNVATPILIVFIIGALLFYNASRTGGRLTKKESIILIILYLSFILIEGSREYLVS